MTTATKTQTEARVDELVALVAARGWDVRRDSTHGDLRLVLLLGPNLEGSRGAWAESLSIELRGGRIEEVRYNADGENGGTWDRVIANRRVTLAEAARLVDC